jgi:hypothetical protein
MKCRVWVAAVIAAFAIAPGAYAQATTTTGSIGGQVVDQQGLPLPGATVTITSGQGSQTFVTDNQGRFNAPFLTPGLYRVRAELQGFKPAENRSVEVRLGQRADVPLTLAVGGLTETVEVTGSRAVVDTTSTAVGANIDSQMLARFPSTARLPIRSTSRPASAAAAVQGARIRPFRVRAASRTSTWWTA